jgi:hypothetical protein
MLNQRALPLGGSFNTVPVLHSNQPEQVLGPGILVDTRPGGAFDDYGQRLPNPTYRFSGPFGLHLHHKYAVSASTLNSDGRRAELTLAVVFTNPGPKPVTVRLDRGAVRNSFAAPYLGQNLLGVKPLGARPWNTGPGDATAVQMLRGKLDASLPASLTIPARDRIVLLRERLPAQGMANALLRGESDGPFHLSVVAAEQEASDGEVLAVLDGSRLAPGREYLAQLEEIRSGQVFSRVSGVAIGDRYDARISHDLERSGPLHVPLTSTIRQDFGTGDVQVNRLATRMPDSALNNVGTYGVLFNLTLKLRGVGPYVVVMSHPEAPDGRPFIAFRGSILLTTPAGEQAVHVGLRSGESLPLTTLQLSAGQVIPLQVSLVYPADSTPGHLLSVVPASQWEQLPVLPRPSLAASTASTTATTPTVASLTPSLPSTAPARRVPSAKSGPATKPAIPVGRRKGRGQGPLIPPADLTRRPGRGLQAAPVLRPPLYQSRPSPTQAGTLADRYRQALEAQERLMGTWQLP